MNRAPNDFADADVIRQVLEGNVDAFELLLDRYQGHVSRIVSKHVPRDTVEEVAHETFVRAYQSLNNFRASESFKYWLSTIAVRCCYDFWREQYKHRETPVSSMSRDCQEWIDKLLSERSQESFAGQTQRQEALSLLHWALEQLSAQDRMVLTLTYFGEYSVAEAAKFLGWSVPNVKIRSHRAKKKLRKVLSKALPGDRGVRA